LLLTCLKRINFIYRIYINNECQHSNEKDNHGF